MLNHPLVSPATAQNWIGCPPLWIAVGSGERLIDGAKAVAQNAASQGVTVAWTEYEEMSHLWPLLFRTWPQSQLCLQSWAHSCKAPVGGTLVEIEGK